MADVAIICLGNRYLAFDAVGPRVFDYLAGVQVPAQVDLIDGGLCGLDLLRSVEGRRRVVFADTVEGLGPANEITQLAGAQVAAYGGAYGHAAGLPYLLRMLPQVSASAPPEIVLLGSTGDADPLTIALLARRCLELAVDATC